MHPHYRLRLYIAGHGARSERAIGNAKALEDAYGSATLRLEIVDALERPELAEFDRIIATPTLMRVSPKPEIRIVGDLGCLEQIAHALRLTIAESGSD